MITLHFSSGEKLPAYWAEERLVGTGGAIVEVDGAPFAQLAAVFEGATSVSWEDDNGKLCTVDYSRIKYMTRNIARVQVIVDKEAVA